MTHAAKPLPGAPHPMDGVQHINAIHLKLRIIWQSGQQSGIVGENHGEQAHITASCSELLSRETLTHKHTLHASCLKPRVPFRPPVLIDTLPSRKRGTFNLEVSSAVQMERCAVYNILYSKFVYLNFQEDDGMFTLRTTP